MIWLASWPLWKWNFLLRTFVIRYEDCETLCGLIDDESDSDRKTICCALTNMNSFSSEDSCTSPWSMKLILLVKSIKDTYIFFLYMFSPQQSPQFSHSSQTSKSLPAQPRNFTLTPALSDLVCRACLRGNVTGVSKPWYDSSESKQLATDRER